MPGHLPWALHMGTVGVGVAGLVVSAILLPWVLGRMQPAPAPVPERTSSGTAVLLAMVFHVLSLSLLPSFLYVALSTRLMGHASTGIAVLVTHWTHPVVLQPVMLGVSAVGMLVSVAFCLKLPALFLLGDERTLGIGTAPLATGVRQGLLVLLVVLPGWYPFTEICAWTLELAGRELSEQPTVALLRLHLALDNHGTLALLALTAVVCAPLAEELVYRGLLYPWLAIAIGRLPAILLSGLLFGIVHFNLAALLPLSVLGMLLALVRERTGSLWPCIVLHSAFNGTQVLAVLFGLG